MQRFLRPDPILEQDDCRSLLEDRLQMIRERRLGVEQGLVTAYD